MLEIDGSYGEGGGQILRTAVALSVLNQIPIKITKIRANRPDPGIKPQHFTAIKCIKDICSAQTTGLEIGSSNLTFTPGDIKGGSYKFDIGTAGSIILVFQTCILASLKSKESLTIQIKGGTENKWAPTWDYFQCIFIPLLKKFGINIETSLKKRGYYPKGGGEAIITINPIDEIKPIKFSEKQIFSNINGIINISNLPDHISTRIKHTVIKELLKDNLKSDIKVASKTSLSAGCGITLWAESSDTILGITVLGERGKSSEEVGKSAANNILNEMKSGANLDIHVFDQLIPYFIISNKNGISSCNVREISSHANTNMWVLKQFFNVNFEIKQNEKNYTILIKNK